jgi:hypothetical protein
MKHFLFLLSTTFFIVFFSSCDEQGLQSEGNRAYLPSYIGQSGEIAIIVETDIWNGSVGDSLQEHLKRPIPLMPAYEPMFDLYQHPPSTFNKTLKPFRNIILIDIADNINYKTPQLKVMKERFAKDQLMIKIGVTSKNAFHEVFEENVDKIVRLFNEAELERTIKYFERFNNAEVRDKILADKNVRMLIPDNCDLLENREDFVWVSRDMSRSKGGRMHDVQQGILIYEYPYLDDSTFTKNYLLNVRDSILKANVPGPVDSSWMTTSYVYDPVFRPINLDNEYATEIRGLWRVENAFMGGPFISVSRVDEKRGRVVTAEGYVFAPKFDKREYLREVEAVVKSMEFE